MPPLNEPQLAQYLTHSAVDTAVQNVNAAVQSVLPEVMRFLHRRYGSAAEDIAQDAVVRVLEKTHHHDRFGCDDRYRDPELVIGLLFGTARNLGVNFLFRRRNPEVAWDMEQVLKTLPPDPVYIDGTSNASEVELVYQEELSQTPIRSSAMRERPLTFKSLKSVFSTCLSTEQWLVLQLFASGFTVSQISQRLNCTPARVSVLRYRASRKLCAIATNLHRVLDSSLRCDAKTFKSLKSSFLECLSEREWRILELKAMGLANAQIACRLPCHPDSVLMLLDEARERLRKRIQVLKTT
jgi:RNA polymerase sigma factor (sigma-70 family)